MTTKNQNAATQTTNPARLEGEEGLARMIDAEIKVHEARVADFAAAVANNGVAYAVTWCADAAARAEWMLVCLRHLRKFAAKSTVGDLVDGMRSEHREIVRRLLGWNPSHSTNALSNEMDNAKHAADREFGKFLEDAIHICFSRDDDRPFRFL